MVLLSYLWLPIKAITNYRRLILNSIRNDIRQKYKGSVIGIYWALLYPLCLFCIYVTLYLVIFRVRPLHMTSNEYVVYLMSGLIPFLGFSEALISGTTSLSTNKSLLLNTLYPSEFIPLQAIVSGHMSLFVGLVLLIIVSGFLLGKISLLLLLLPVLVLMQLMFVCGIVWYLSMLSLVIRDIKQILGLITMLIMIISPIAYTPDMVPHALKFVIWANPFSYFARCYQDLFLFQELTSLFFITMLMSILFFCSGYYFFCKVKRVFHDYV